MDNRWRYRVGSHSSILGRPPKFYDSKDLKASGCSFASVYAIRQEDAEAIETTAGTASSFKGIVWSRRLWIDFDTYEAADEAQAHLEEMKYDHVVYDTGGRGRHVGVLRTASPSHTLPAQDKQWVEESIKGADLSLYWHLHLIRLPGALHERTGKTKRLLRAHAGRALVLQPLRETVRSVRSEGGSEVEILSRTSVFSQWAVVSLLHGARGGDRHRHLVCLAKTLKEEAGVTFEEALWVAREVNRGFKEGPKSEEEVLRIVRWAYGLEG